MILQWMERLKIWNNSAFIASFEHVHYNNQHLMFFVFVNNFEHAYTSCDNWIKNKASARYWEFEFCVLLLWLVRNFYVGYPK